MWEPSFVIRDVVDTDRPHRHNHVKAEPPPPPKELHVKKPDSRPKGRPFFKLRSPKKELQAAQNAAKPIQQLPSPPPQHVMAQKARLVKMLSGAAVLPKKNTANSAGYDLSSTVDAVVSENDKAIVPTCIAVAIPEGTYGRIAPRSGLAAKHHLAVGAGVIDAAYRANVRVVLFNHGNLDFHVSKGDRIAQLLP